MARARRKSKYTAAQKRAESRGQGYRAGYEDKQVPFRSEKNKESFRQGFASVKETVSKYPELNKR